MGTFSSWVHDDWFLSPLPRSCWVLPLQRLLLRPRLRRCLRRIPAGISPEATLPSTTTAPMTVLESRSRSTGSMCGTPSTVLTPVQLSSVPLRRSAMLGTPASSAVPGRADEVVVVARPVTAAYAERTKAAPTKSNFHQGSCLTPLGCSTRRATRFAFRCLLACTICLRIARWLNGRRIRQISVAHPHVHGPRPATQLGGTSSWVSGLAHASQRRRLSAHGRTRRTAVGRTGFYSQRHVV